VLVEVFYYDGAAVRTGRVLAAEFINQGKSYRAAYFQGDKNTGGFYASDGKSLRKTFLRSPLEFSRVTSGYSLSRFHPILKKWGSHRGIDYGAPSGTRIRATANGKVNFVGTQGGYGKMVVLQHAGSITTVYGHLSAFAKGLRKGQQVSQGEIIGYVGATGLATGPHLHYEFRVGNEQRNPLKVVMPPAAALNVAELERFRTHAEPLLAQLDMLREINLAFAD
jgi:murein DD-endopeptidase MepM/ murein hydrolase activator NlpD